MKIAHWFRSRLANTFKARKQKSLRRRPVFLERLEDRSLLATLLACPGTTYPTIQDAVNAAAAGDTIQVCAGTFPEHVVIDKTLTVNGANAGVNPVTSVRGAESIVDGTLTGAPFDIAANGVTIDGFTIINAINGLNAGIATTSTVGGYHIQNNIITNNTIGVYANSNAAAFVQNNLFDANNLPGPSGGAGIYSDQGAIGLTITGNEFRNHTLNNPILLVATSAQAYTGLTTVSNNNLHDNVSGIFAVSINGGVFDSNTIRTTPAATAMTFGGANTNIQVTNNDLSNNLRGLRIADYGYFGATPNSNFTVECNNFANDSEFGLGVINATADGGNATAYTGTLDASPNWWGSITGPTIASNPGGTGSVIRNDNAPAVTIVYSPWATDPSCTTVTGGPGTVTQQPDPCNPTAQALVIVGTSGNDDIHVKPKGANQFVVRINGVVRFVGNTADFAGGHIIVFAGAGNDVVCIDPKVAISSMLFGEAGNDNLKAGIRPTLLVGGDGNDVLKGCRGRDILIGGRGRDNLRGDAGADLLIAGNTDFDANLTALCAIMDQWVSSVTVNSLLTTGLNGTVHDDGVQDNLDGQAGLDLFFATLTGKNKDIVHKTNGEVVIGTT